MLQIRRTLLSGVALTVPMLTSPMALAQPQGDVGEFSDVTIQNSVVEPEPIIVTDDEQLTSLIRVPEGFEIDIIARDLGNTRMLAVHEDGGIYVTRRTEGDVIRLDDGDDDGTYEDQTVLAARPGMHGIAFDGDTVFLATVNDVYTAPVNEDGSFGELTRIIDDLPDAGQHPNRTLAIGPDDMLYISVGSTCNACAESNPENATMLRASKDGKSRTIFATGLRNTIGFGWQPETGELFGADHGTDWLGDEEQQEEFNLIERGNQYGWPYIYDFSNFNPQDNPPEGITLEAWAEKSVEPELGYIAHAAPMQMTFYSGTAFPEEYRGDAFVAMRGSWNRRPPSGYEVTRIDFENGEPQSWERFAEGWLIENEDGGYGFLARLAGLAEAPDGSLILADDANGILYRISYAGEQAADGAVLGEPESQVPEPRDSDIAFDLVEGEDSLEVSASFQEGEMMPVAYAAEGHNASPELEWSGAPEGTQSFVVIVDDPDASNPSPFTHWVAYDIPADVTRLRESLPPDLILQEPEGVLQGTNSRGQVGYMGPRPPLEDGPHDYHFQIFALDVASLELDPGAQREAVLSAMEGHVLAKGQLVGQYERPAPEHPMN
jgi:Raf kinase inhibitor-like YbhB/YbcL family protein